MCSCSCLSYLPFFSSTAENVLVDSENNVKLCDFGFARSLETQRGRTTTILGTPYYSSPEILLGKPYDWKADVFAFGMLVLELITRRTVNVERMTQRDQHQPCGVDVVGLQKKIPKTLGYPAPFLKLAFVCVEFSSEKRPTMKQAESMMQAIEKSLTK